MSTSYSIRPDGQVEVLVLDAEPDGTPWRCVLAPGETDRAAALLDAEGLAEVLAAWTPEILAAWTARWVGS